MPVKTELSPWGRNVRAALMLADMELPELAVEMNISEKTLRRMMSAVDKREPSPWETRRAAEVLRVPMWFIRDGLTGLPDSAVEELNIPAVDAEMLVSQGERIESVATEVRDTVADIHQQLDRLQRHVGAG